MQEQYPPVCAAVDIGSNTIRIVIAKCMPDHLDILAADEAMVRIGESVNTDGMISSEKRKKTLTVLRRYKALTRSYNTSHFFVIATEAIRKAQNKDAFIAEIKDAIGVPVAIIDGNIEAALMFYGVTYTVAQDAHVPNSVGVMDLGGGSTEFVLARKGHITGSTSLPIGSGWIHDRYFTADPPTAVDMDTASTFLQTFLAGIPIKRFPKLCLVTGGTANVLLHLAQKALRLSTERVTLTRDEVLRCEGLLCSLSSREIAERYQIDEKRARVLIGGVLIIHAVMDRYHIAEIQVSEHGIREGVLIAYARYGENWLEAVRQQMQSGRKISPYVPGAEEPQEDFVQFGQQRIHERAEQMFGWRNDVLAQQDNDIEPVHKMRVASRRLRALMDAYQSIGEPEAFKYAYRSVKKTADTLGNARDTDVMIATLRQQLEDIPEKGHPGILWLIDRLSCYRDQYQEELSAYIHELDERELMVALDASLAERDSQNGKS
ncbi:MAG TPA: CHAD domain-containing protein [Dictyobacter sp.]|jgi:exopolyphosphatase/pppGpp-phosphohydrolase|nr:CHAD domain-containing protein [Dictyobacter sp.]